MKDCQIFALAVMCAMLCACTQSAAKLEDGTYYAEMSGIDRYGWTPYAKITVSDGKISAAETDCKNARGEKKSQDEDYREAMEQGVDTYPEKVYQQLAQELLDKQDPGKIEMVAGATASSEEFKLMVSELLDQRVKVGDTSELIVDMPEDLTHD